MKLQDAFTYKCGMCRFRGVSDSIVRNHVNTKHKLTCRECGMVFFRKAALNWHRYYNHEGGVWSRAIYGSGVKPEFTSKYWNGYKVREKQTKIGYSEVSYNISFKNYKKEDNRDMVNRINFVKKVVYDVAKHFRDRMSESDTLQLILYGNPTDIKHMFSTHFMTKSEISYDFIAKKCNNFMNSNEHFAINDDMSLDVKHITTHGGGVTPLTSYNNITQALLRKKCVLTIKNNDNLCFSRSVITALYHHKRKNNHVEKRLWNKVRQNTGSFLTYRSRMLQKSTGLGGSSQIQISDINKFEKVLKDFGISLYSIFNGKVKILYTTSESNKPTLNILYCNNHYMPITNLRCLNSMKYTCNYCGSFSGNPLFHHVCRLKCYFCHSFKHDILKSESVYKCGKCGQFFFSKFCYKKHLEKIYRKQTESVCDIFKKCKLCHSVHNVGSSCNINHFCDFCQVEINGKHDCYINPPQKPKRKYGYVVYDIESALEVAKHTDLDVHTIHVPNLVCSRKLCGNCLSGAFLLECEKCEIKFFSHSDCIINFLSYLSKLKNIIVIAHNGSKYDNIFILRHVWEIFGNKLVKVLPNGNNVFAIEIGRGDIIFRDSNLFFKSALRNLPKLFGFESIEKGIYPYRFNCSKNYNYSGPLPDIAYYYDSIDKTNDQCKADFLIWYKENKYTKFEFWSALKKYCLTDVNILSMAVVFFRKHNLKYNIEPFLSYSIAHMTFNIFTTNFLEKDQIARLREKRENTSVKCQNWLSYYEAKHNVTLIRANSPQEYRIPLTNYRADGYLPSKNLILEFYGCWIHSDPRHYTANDRVFNGEKAGERYKKTLKRECRIKQLGYNLLIMWECDWDKFVESFCKTSHELDYFPIPISIRSALYGGRCEVFSVYNDFIRRKVKGRSVDIVSLYPHVMATKRFPIKKPILLNKSDITLPFNINIYFGLVMCEVEAPEKLFLPVLPYKTKDKKLMFPLCRRCAEEKILKCSHFGLQCRNLVGCWTTVELELAISEGYRIIKVHQIYNFKDSSTTLFKQFVMEMIIKKIEASGYAKNVTSSLQRKEFRKNIYKNMGVKLDPQKIQFNPASRVLHKNILTNLWGKFAQSPSKRNETVLVNSTKSLMEINEKITSHKIVLNNCYGLDENSVLVDFSRKKEHIAVPFSSNPILASFVTAYGRIELYKYMKIIGKNICYSDTDSCYFYERENEISKLLNLGDSLGMMKDELSEHNYITTMICLASKTYGYLTFLEENGKIQTIRNKGFSTAITEKTNVDNFINLYKNKDKYISITNKNYFLKNRVEGAVYMKKLSKKFNFNYKKRIVISDNETLPWGYKM